MTNITKKKRKEKRLHREQSVSYLHCSRASQNIVDQFCEQSTYACYSMCGRHRVCANTSGPKHKIFSNFFLAKVQNYMEDENWIFENCLCFLKVFVLSVEYKFEDCSTVTLESEEAFRRPFERSVSLFSENHLNTIFFFFECQLDGTFSRKVLNFRTLTVMFSRKQNLEYLETLKMFENVWKLKKKF